MQQEQNSKNQLFNLAFNIILPVIILNQLGKKLGEDGPLVALIIALSLPIGYAIYEYLKIKKLNIFSVLGVINILLTGGLALFQVEGIWFAVKEAMFPLVIGLGVLYSAFTTKPLINILIFNENILKVDQIKMKLEEFGTSEVFVKELKKSTIYLSFSFFMSAILNFGLAVYIFVEIPKTITKIDQAVILNEQIAKMTWMSYIVILIPSLIFMGLIFYHLSKAIEKNTGLKFDEIMKS
jgi:hypothetical protein